jgi:hypothetical protein
LVIGSGDCYGGGYEVDQPVVAQVHHTLFVCVIFMPKKSAVVKFVPKDVVVIVFLGIPMPPVRRPRPNSGSATVGGRVNQKSDTRPPRPPIPPVRPPPPLIPTVRRPCKQPSDQPAAAAADYQTLISRGFDRLCTGAA